MTRYAPDTVQAEVIDNGFHPQDDYLVITIVSLVVGIMLLVNPLMSITIVCYLIGAGFIVGGILSIRRANLQRDVGIPSTITFGLGILAILAGFFVVVGRNAIVSMVPFFFGLALVIDGVFKLTAGVDLRSSQVNKWESVSVTAVITIILGIIVIIHPFGVGVAMTRILGLFLVLNGAANLWYLFVAKDKPNRMRR